MQTIDLTPTWQEALNICLFALESGTANGKKEAKQTLKQMADVAQLHVNHTKTIEQYTVRKSGYGDYVALWCGEVEIFQLKTTKENCDTIAAHLQKLVKQ